MTLEIINKTQAYDKIIRKRHNIEGLILPTLVLPPAGREDYQTGNFENCAIWTGVYIAAQSLRYAITKEQEAIDSAREGVSALHKLQDITTKEGLVARAFKVGDLPTWDEDFFWKKKGDKTRYQSEWHQVGKRQLPNSTRKLAYRRLNLFCINF